MNTTDLKIRFAAAAASLAIVFTLFSSVAGLAAPTSRDVQLANAGAVTVR